MNETIFSNPIEDVFNEYQLYMNSQDEFNASLIRRVLVRRLLKEGVDVLNSPMYQMLIRDESQPRRSPLTTNPTVLSLTPLGQALQVRNGSETYTLEEIERLPYFNFGTSNLYVMELVRWVVLQFLGENDVALKEDMIHKATIRTTLKHLKSINTDNLNELIDYSKELDRRMQQVPNPKDKPYFARDTIRACLTFFLLFNRLGDEVNAKYYLMKASQFNYDNNETEMLVLFLENVFLVGE